ncbi:hypothetical protein A9264_13540 [Vibrio sp. UCD-FRSSP16_10]|uniref:hypothetical protein n=1 Tax=unclassified Vibrio TaxID=2614977 RepID=UPI0007FD7458|nr:MULTISPECIES: hypothetical protein [unclassified Vibrio]OBT14794.1 hypothetical protein A9260_13755 [Vibrio sp. UCD-FRSSP16_30]OBT20083.1 hypothetical protein A9264_13540 [Vibrio sp. UCD-FRSSP16_10]
MNKVKALAAAGIILSATAAHADTGTPVNTKPRSYSNHSDFKVGVGFDQGFGVTAELYDTVNAFIGNDGLSADYLVIKDQRFSPKLPFTYYVGVGGFYDFNKTWHGNEGHWTGYHHQCDSYDSNGNCHHWNDGYWARDEDQHFNEYGIRVPLGLDWQFAPQWDGYASLAPTVDVPDDFHFSVDAALGVRYAFK